MKLDLGLSLTSLPVLSSKGAGVPANAWLRADGTPWRKPDGTIWVKGAA